MLRLQFDSLSHSSVGGSRNNYSKGDPKKAGKKVCRLLGDITNKLTNALIVL